MDLVKYLVDIYGYDTPIFIKDIRIGRKSKSAIREEFYRAVKKGALSRDGSGVYSIPNKTDDLTSVVTFERIIKGKYLVSKDVPVLFNELFIEGYYSGLTFLNIIGLSDQVPAVLEITTNRIGGKKYIYSALGRYAIIRKGKTKIDSSNYKMLQFLDMFHYLTMDEVNKYKNKIIKYINDEHLSKGMFLKYLGLYKGQTMKKIVEGGIIDAFM